MIKGDVPSATGTTVFDFDQTHILTLIASYDFPLNWRIGARFRLVSGKPYTAVNNGDGLSYFGATAGGRALDSSSLALGVRHNF